LCFFFCCYFFLPTYANFVISLWAAIFHVNKYICFFLYCIGTTKLCEMFDPIRGQF
jgi:hypothetical protein